MKMKKEPTKNAKNDFEEDCFKFINNKTKQRPKLSILSSQSAFFILRIVLFLGIMY